MLPGRVRDHGGKRARHGEMGIAAALSFVLFGVCGVLHYAVMTDTHERLVRSSRGRGARLSICLYTAGFAHLVEAALYAAGFMLGQRVGIGGFAKENATSFMDTFYFSLVNFTSLGLGRSIPRGTCACLPASSRSTGSC